MTRHRRRGMTLIEVVVAILVLSVGGLALAGSSALMIRQMAESSRRATAVSLARGRSETSFSRPCTAIADGQAQFRDVSVDWLVAGGAGITDITQRVTYPTARGTHSEQIVTAVPCD